MITLRRAADRHCTQRSGQRTSHTFVEGVSSIPRDAGFGSLEELSEIYLEPGAGPTSYPRGEAEIVTYVVTGTLAQGDSTGWSGVLRTDEFQLSSAGRLVRHAHQNASNVEPAHSFRLAVLPSQAELPYARAQQRVSVADRRNVLRAVASFDGRSGSLRIHQDALIWSSIVDAGRHMIHDVAPGRQAWLHIVRGEATFDGLILSAGDGVGVSDEAVSFTARAETEVLLIEVADVPASLSWQGGSSPDQPATDPGARP